MMTAHRNRRVNPWMLSALLTPIATNPDDDSIVYPELDSNDREMITKYAIIDRIKPSFDQWDEASKTFAKDTLRYYLNFPPVTTPNDYFYRRVLYIENPVFDAPDDAKLFFLLAMGRAIWSGRLSSG